MWSRRWGACGVRGLVLAVVLSGCTFTPPGVGGDPGRDGGAPGDAGPVDARDRDAAPPIDAGPFDSTPAYCSPGPCQAAGGTCSVDDTKCVIVRGDDGAIVCPAGMPCEAICVGPEACKVGGVDCSRATSCRITCEGAEACQDAPVRCGGTSCDVRCFGTNACQSGGVACGGTPCTVTCDGENTCQEGISCEPATACTAHCCGDNACEGSTCACAEDAVCP